MRTGGTKLVERDLRARALSCKHLKPRLYRASGLCALISIVICSANPACAVAEAEVGRAVALLFAGIPAAAAGDVNADGLATAADVCGVLLDLRNPTQRGPFGVGTQRMIFTKESATMPGVLRALDTYIWYPADPVTASLDIYPRGRRDAPLPEDINNLPLVMFSHGSCGIPTQSFFLVTTLASYGFIVAAPPHPGNTTADCVLNPSPGQFADSAQNRPADIIFVIDRLLELNSDPASFFHNAIDAGRIGMTGHSFGGYTTLRVCAADSRVRAGVALAPAFFGIENEVASIDTGHYAFSDLCVPSDECGQPTTLTQEEAHWAALRYAVPFLLRYVAEDDRFGAFLEQPSTPPGIVLTAEIG
jgi:dienelactone hydrolase